VNIVAFSINPLFPGSVMGGAPKHLQSIVVHLGEQGHRVTVLCTRHDDSAEAFHWHENVQVLPVLRFKQPFPQPYAVPAYDLAAALYDVGEYLQAANRFYMHDGEFLFPYAYQHVPTVVSLRDNVYPETIHGGFLFQGDRLILISEYQRQYFVQTAGRFFPGYAARTDVIHNGVDWAHFQPTTPREIHEIVPLPPGAGPIVLHPHRPEADKGIFQTIAVVDRLVHHYGFADLLTLVPRWIDHGASADLRAFYDTVRADIAQRDLGAHFLFHDWIPQRLMPQYYSLGSVTLALGSFVESFGNAVYESFGCGTPAIAARIGSHRELLPEALAFKVDFDDADTAAHLAADIIRAQQRTPPATLAYLREHYDVQRQRAAYADAIVNARLRPPLAYQHPTLNDSTRFVLPVWCARAAAGIYHDFRVEYRAPGALGALLAAHPEGFTFAQAQAGGAGRDLVLAWYRDGYLVPQPA
jgi:glycosyltransferase involved in cell wall biosynthesis